MLTKKVTVKKSDLGFKKIVFKSNDLNIYEEVEGVYTFDIGTSLYTMDVLEAISYLIKNKEFENEKFWNLNLKDNMVHYIVPTNSLYWLSGGDDFWNEWSFKWVDNYEVYEKRFQMKLYDIFQDSVTLKDVKDKLIKQFNLDVFYEFALFTKLKKEKS
ncbi:MAG: hypothetical protein RLZZ546_459 [Bacteroidota bacterium]|jgi:hypothetical protein